VSGKDVAVSKVFLILMFKVALRKDGGAVIIAELNKNFRDVPACLCRKRK
jgi:hypothetical protein